MWIDTERLIHSFKTALACLVGFALTKALHNYLFFDQWLIVTILVVMCAQISVGSIIFKSTMRFVGTALGSLLAALTLTFFSNNPLIFAAVIALAGLAFSYLATSQNNYSDAATLGAVTTAIVLINPHPTLMLTVKRFLEITAGIVIATLISQFVLPIHARKHLRRSQAKALKLLGEFYRKSLVAQTADQEKMAELDEEIIRTLATQRKQAHDAQRELLGSKFETNRFQKIMQAEKHILRSIDFLNRMYSEMKIHHFLENNAEWRQFNRAIADNFDQIALRAENPELTSAAIVTPTADKLKEEITQGFNIKEEGWKNIHALFFCLDNLTKQVGELAKAIA